MDEQLCTIFRWVCLALSSDLLLVFGYEGVSPLAKPFEVYGLNALVVFVLSTLMAKLMFVIPIYTASGQTTIKGFMYDNILLPIASPLNASLIFAMLYVLF